MLLPISSKVNMIYWRDVHKEKSAFRGYSDERTPCDHGKNDQNNGIYSPC